MISKNSFWVSLKENNKRRIWLWILSAFTYLVVLPTVTAMFISSYKTNNSYLIEQYGESAGMERIRQETMNQLLQIFNGDNLLLLVIISGVAIVSGIQGFSYLYHKNKIDFYQAAPVKQSRRFLTIWLNGVLVYLIPGFAGTVLCLLVMVGNRMLTAEILQQTGIAFFLLLFVYLGCYHMTILAVMLTGNVLITCLGTGIFFLYEWMVRSVLSGYKLMFFPHYSTFNQSDMPYFSPIAMFIRYSEKRSEGQEGILGTVLQLSLFSGIVLALAYWCYRKRPAEAAGRAMAFKVTQPVIKIALAIPASLFAGLIVSNIVGYSPLWNSGSPGFPVFSMAIVVVVVCCLMQVVYEFDIRGILHKKWHILISSAAAALIFLVFSKDLTGYNSYVPKVDRVSSAVLISPYEYSVYGDDYYDENLKYEDRMEYLADNMYLSDIGSLNKLLQKSIDSLGKYSDLSALYEDENAEWYCLNVMYRMGNHKTVQREFYVNMKDQETLDLLDRVIDSEEYISAVYGKMMDTIYQIMEKHADGIKLSYTYGNSIDAGKLSEEDALTLMKCFMEDIRKTDFSETRKEISYGSLEIAVQQDNGFYTMNRHKEFRIYPSYENCAAFLKEKGLYKEIFIDPDEVEKIQVINYNWDKSNTDMAVADTAVYTESMTDSAEPVYYEDTYAYEGDPYMVRQTYSDRDKIEEISHKLYPMDQGGADFTSDVDFDTDYEVIVYFKPESSITASYTGSVGCYFLKGEVPEYVQEDTACQE